MPGESLFQSRLGAAFGRLEPKLQWVHGGESRELQGTVTVERGLSFVAKGLDKQRWIRVYARTHRMTSVLSRRGDALVEQVGPAALTFGIVERDGAMAGWIGTCIRYRWSAFRCRQGGFRSRRGWLLKTAAITS